MVESKGRYILKVFLSVIDSTLWQFSYDIYLILPYFILIDGLIFLVTFRPMVNKCMIFQYFEHKYHQSI